MPDSVVGAYVRLAGRATRGLDPAPWLIPAPGEDRDRRDIRGRGRLTLVDPLADQDLERLMARVTGGWGDRVTDAQMAS
jgi:hypothetical protein